MPKKRMTEKKVEDAVVKYAKKTYGMKVRKMNGRGYRSWPDRLFIHNNGVSFWIEFKKPGIEEVTPGQEEIIKDLRARGFAVYVVNDVAIGKKLIDTIVFKTMKRKIK